MSIGLVLEGGAMRGMYTAGVLDVFLEKQIKVDGIVAVSAGVLFGVNYLSNQKGRVIRYNKKFIKDKTNIKEQIEEALFIFILPPSMEELKKRLIERNTETKEKILERFKTAYNEINEIKKYNYVVVNDRVDYAVEKVKSIIKAEKCRVDRIEEIYLNTKEEFIHEGLIEKEFVNEDVKI